MGNVQKEDMYRKQEVYRKQEKYRNRKSPENRKSAEKEQKTEDIQKTENAALTRSTDSDHVSAQSGVKVEGIKFTILANLGVHFYRKLYDGLAIFVFHRAMDTWKQENNNDNSDIVLYPVHIHVLVVLYVVNIQIHLTIQKAQVLQMHTSMSTWQNAILCLL